MNLLRIFVQILRSMNAFEKQESYFSYKNKAFKKYKKAMIAVCEEVEGLFLRIEDVEKLKKKLIKIMLKK